MNDRFKLARLHSLEQIEGAWRGRLEVNIGSTDRTEEVQRVIEAVSIVSSCRCLKNSVFEIDFQPQISTEGAARLQLEALCVFINTYLKPGA